MLSHQGRNGRDLQILLPRRGDKPVEIFLLPQCFRRLRRLVFRPLQPHRLQIRKLLRVAGVPDGGIRAYAAGSGIIVILGRPASVLTRTKGDYYVSQPVEKLGRIRELSIIKRGAGGVAQELLIEADSGNSGPAPLHG